jgi:hypothetical protein
MATARVQPADAALILQGEARYGETVVRKYFKIVQFLEMTIADVLPSFVPFPDQQVHGGFVAQGSRFKHHRETGT